MLEFLLDLIEMDIFPVCKRSVSESKPLFIEKIYLCIETQLHFSFSKQRDCSKSKNIFVSNNIRSIYDN